VGEMREKSSCKILFGRLKGKRPFGRSNSRLEDNKPEFVKVYYNAQKQHPQNKTIHVAYLHG
jgi:hypothetical protein